MNGTRCVAVGGGEQTTAKTKADPCGMTTKGQAAARVTAKTKAVDEKLKEKKRGFGLSSSLWQPGRLEPLC